MRQLLVGLLMLTAACGASATSSTTAIERTTASTAAEAASPSPSGASAAPTISAAESGPGAVALEACPRGEARDGAYALSESTEQAGLIDPLVGMHGHAVAWGDTDLDGFPDLFVGTFGDRPADRYAFRGSSGPSTDTLLMGDGTTFSPAAGFEADLGRTSGAVFADLDNDGDLDLVAARNAREGGDGAAGLPTAVYRNDGTRFSAVDAGFDSTLGGRSIGVLDQDGDGLLDLFIVEDRYRGGTSRLFRNLGDLRFEDVTTSVGIPAGVNGLGVAVGDISGDGRSDLFVSGSNRLFIAADGEYREVESDVFAWETFGDEDIIAGVDLADVDVDGRLDLVVGHHYNSTVDFDTEVAIRLYLNRSEGDTVAFVDATDAAGLIPLPTKAPHVEFADMNNDGLLDIVTSASADNGTAPAIFLGEGIIDGVPRFTTPTGLGSDQYWVASPTVDMDRDGRLDVFVVEWEPALPSRLFMGSNSGRSISVALSEPHLAPGTNVAVYRAGAMDDPAQLLGHRELTASKGYSSGSELRAHFGVADAAEVDIVLTLRDGTRIEASGLATDQHYVFPDGCGV